MVLINHVFSLPYIDPTLQLWGRGHENQNDFLQNVENSSRGQGECRGGNVER
jgi:hypothetical protein